MPLKLNSTNGSITISAEDGSGNANITLPRSGIGSVSALSDLSITATATEINTLDGVPATLTATELGYVDGVTSAIQTQIDTKAPLASPALTGTPTAPTATAGDNSTKIATTAFVGTEVSNLVDSAPSTLNTLNELAAALGDDASFSTTVTNSIATKLPLSGGTMTGDIAHASDFTVDAGGDIILDADGGDFFFKDAGTSIGLLKNNNSDFEMRSLVNDKDIKFSGEDGGSTITALTLDMSEAGKATFNSTISDADGDVRAIPQSGSDKTSSYTLTTGDIGNFVGIGSGGSITVPNSTFSAGDAISIFNNTSGDRTITCSITTAYIGGEDADKASVTLATRGVCTILFISGTVCVITGNVS